MPVALYSLCGNWKKRDQMVEHVCDAQLQLHAKLGLVRQQLRNFQVFDEPIALYFTVNKTMGIGPKMHSAMMIQNVMVAVKTRGLDTCPQAAWIQFHGIGMGVLNTPQDEELVCTVRLGYADPEHIVNNFITPRIAVEEFAVFMDA